ncbi:MAG: hypothetical protein PHT44_02920 [Candidatus Portnoybacteria bacterium]|nr:hypothetical protein [Candidatus Portnoybacteria bacterium]MDD4982494.1 hypothetical protein [Candidatus Portnoybacteria bacterium]
MTENIQKFITENWAKLPTSERCPAPTGPIRLSKFYHGRANWQSKVLFLATNDGSPICLIKTTRDAAANEKLKREKEAQEKFGQANELAAPRVYFDGLVGESYFYAEEVIFGQPLSESVAFQKEKEILELARSFGAVGQISAKVLAEIFRESAPNQDAESKNLLNELVSSEAVIKTGFTHGDLTRKNIINSRGRLRLIDWERAGERPFWLLDAVHFFTTLRNIKNLSDWRQRGQAAFCQIAGVPSSEALALYCIEAILEILGKQYPEKYDLVVGRLAQLKLN